MSMPYKDPLKQREYQQQYAKRYRLTSADKLYAHTKKWRKKNWDKHLATAKRYRDKNRPKINTWLREFYHSHKGDPDYQARRKELAAKWRTSPQGQASIKAWREKHGREHNQKWYRENTDRARELARQNYARNPEKYKAEVLAYRKAHPEKARLYSRIAQEKRRIALTKAGGTCTAEQFLARCEVFGWLCAYCLKELTRDTVEIDHVIPISKGGTGWPANLAPACRSCNSKKGNKRILPLKLRKA